jgi:hypothetical protein
MTPACSSCAWLDTQPLPPCSGQVVRGAPIDSVRTLSLLPRSCSSNMLTPVCCRMMRRGRERATRSVTCSKRQKPLGPAKEQRTTSLQMAPSKDQAGAWLEAPHR